MGVMLEPRNNFANTPKQLWELACQRWRRSNHH